MAIQQYDYTACCTGFLQQLPSFWGISTGNRRSFCRSTGRKGQKKGQARRNRRGLQQRSLCPRRRARRAQYVRARRSESLLKIPSERKRDVTGEKGPFLPLLLSALNTLQKLERRAARKMPYYLVPSTVSFSTRGAKLALFSGFFREECEREPWIEVRVLPPCLFFSIHVQPSLSLGAKPSCFFVVLPVGFSPMQGFSFYAKGSFYLFPLCPEESSIRACQRGTVDESNVQTSDEVRRRFVLVIPRLSRCSNCRKLRAQMYMRACAYSDVLHHCIANDIFK